MVDCYGYDNIVYRGRKAQHLLYEKKFFESFTVHYDIPKKLIYFGREINWV